MDYEEFCNATGNNYKLLQQIYDMRASIGPGYKPQIDERS